MTTIFVPLEHIGDHVLSIETWSPQRASSSDEFEYIDIAAVDRENKCLTEPTLISAANAPSRARQIVRGGDVLVSTVRPNLNAVALVPDQLSDAVASTGFCVLRSNPKKLNRNYLFHWVRTNAFIGDMVRKATGASYPAVSDRIIKESKIPLPPLSEQKRIADILDKADAIRRKRQEAHRITQEIPMGAFNFAFRDYLAHAQGTKQLNEVADVVSGVAKGRKLNCINIREVPYLRVANVQAGYLNMSEIKTIPAKQSEVDSMALRRGDVVMTEGGDFDKLGRGALWEHDLLDCIHQNHVFRVRVNHHYLLPTYFVHYLQTEHARKYFLRCAKKTTNLASINMTQLRALPVPLPPLKLQEKFDHEFRLAKDVTERQLVAEREARKLFNSLVQRAFKGDL